MRLLPVLGSWFLAPGSCLDNPHVLWQQTWKRSLILTLLCAAPVLIFSGWKQAFGVVVGAGILVGDIYLLQAPLEMLLGKQGHHQFSGRKPVASLFPRKRTWLLGLNLLKFVAVGAVLLLIVKFRLAGIIGLFAGVALPLVALVSVALTGQPPRHQGTKQKADISNIKCGISNIKLKVERGRSEGTD
jgi:hypothetical protein